MPTDWSKASRAYWPRYAMALYVRGYILALEDVTDAIIASWDPNGDAGPILSEIQEEVEKMLNEAREQLRILGDVR